MKNFQKILFVVISLLSQTIFASSPANQHLIRAFFSNNLADVKTSLAAGANPNMVLDLNTGTASLLLLAAGKNYTTLAQKLVAANANVNFQAHSTGMTALIWAASYGNLELVHTLISAGANPNFQTNAANHSMTALTIAARNNFTPVVKALLNAPTISQSINAKDSTSSTALIYAVHNRNEEMVEALANSEGINDLQNNVGTTALMYAAIIGNETMVKALTRIKGINTNLQDNTGMTALMYAVNKGSFPITHTLIAAGAKTTPHANQANFLDTALLIAVNQQTPSLPIIKALLNAPDGKQSINSKDISGGTALMYAAHAGNLSATEVLIAAGADITITNKQGLNAGSVSAANCRPTLQAAYTRIVAKANQKLLNAIIHNNLSGVKSAIATGANPNAVLYLLNLETSSFLLLAAGKNYTTLAQELIAANANVNFQANNTGMTALIWASSYGNLKLVNALIAAGANPNFQTNAANHSMTALTIAARNNFTQAIEALLKAPKISQSINVKDSSGMTALMYAVKANNETMIKALKNYKKE